MKGDWLAIGGSNSSLHGSGHVEVRVQGEGQAWEWKTLTQDQLEKLLKLANMVKHTEEGELL